VTPPKSEQEPLYRAWPAVPESVAAARSAVAQYASVCGASADVLDAIRLAVSEAFTNAVLHAYPGADQVGTVEVTAEQADRVLLVAVADGGRGMTPRIDSPALGFGLTAHRADDPRLPRPAPRGGGTPVWMRIAL
jgi:anti-sigma regulatory factor (Ser/Thr protein kinase)